MKKLSVVLSTILVIVIVSISFTSCEDPAGVYNPKKKIAKVYQKEVGEAEYLSQEWTWDGNKLASITFYYEGEFEGMDEYTYDGDRVMKVRDNYGYHAEFSYLDKQFDKIKFYDPDRELMIEYAFQYERKKISKITLHFYDDDIDKNLISMMNRGFIGQLLSKEGMKMVAKKMSNHPKESVVMNLSYEGDNLASIKVEDESITFSKYDTHTNVLYNFCPFSTYDNNTIYYIFSKNNPGKSNYNVGAFTITTNYTYTYNGDFPATIQSSMVYGGESYASTTRIEYK